jgi:phage terminase large subunit-like protein
VEAKRAHFVDADGPGVKQLYPRDPAEAGKTVAQLRVAAAIDEGADADMVPATQKVMRKIGPASAAAHPRAMGRESGYGKIRVVRGDWNEPFFDVLESLPEGAHDDDASALAVVASTTRLSDRSFLFPTTMHRAPGAAWPMSAIH